MKIFPSSLLYKALLAIVLVLIPIFITFLHGYNRNREFLKENILSDITVIAEAYEGQVYQFLEMAKRRAMDFSSDGSIKEATQDIGENGNYSAEKLSKHLRDNKLSLDKTLRRVLVASIEGKVLASTDTALIGKDISTEPFFINGKNSPNVTENSATDSLTTEIAVSAPIYGHSGEITGVVANFIDLSELNYLLSGHFNKDLGAISWSKGKKETMEVYLVNRNGFMITDSIFIKDAVLKQAADTLPVRRCLESSTEITGFYDDYRGIEVAGASMCIPSMGWTLLAEIDSSEVLAPIADIRKDAIIAGSVLAGLLGILFTVFFKNVIMRLRALSNASAEMGKGNYDISLPVGSADEIGALSDVFNRMAGEIKDRTKLLADSEARLSAIIENSTTFIYLKDPDGKYLHANSAFNKLVRKPREEIIGKTDFDLFPAATAAHFRKNDESVLEANTPMEFEEVIGSGNGERFYISVKVPIADPSGKIFALCGISADITERKLAEEKIERLNRLYSVLSKTNEAIVRIRDTGKLYEEACRIAVEDGGFLMAWVGLAGPDMEIKPAAFVGADPEYLNGIRISALDIPEGRGPTGSAIREGAHKVCNRIESDRCMDLWREKAKEFGYRSSAAFPVRVGGRPAGSINLYSGEEDFFTDEEVRLLDSMAADISFAVDSIEIEKQGKRADDELHLLQDISLEIKDAEDFQSALKVAITKICAATSWDAGEVWIPAKDGFLEHIASSCALCPEEKPGLQEFLDARKALRFKPDKGIPGMVWSTRKSLWISDVEKQEFVVWRGLIARGFKSAFGTPIFSGDKVLAVLVFFMKEAKEEEDNRFTNIVSAVSAQLGSVIQRKLSEEARLELQKRYEALLNNLTIGIYRNTEGDEGHFIEVNRAFVSMFDADSKEDLLKHRIGDFYFDKGKSDELESRLLGSGYINDEEVELVTLKGRRFWASMTAIMKKDVEGKVFFDGFVEDITEKKKLEEQLRYSQKMEAVGQLAGGVAHDFNNILTALIGYGNLLLMKRSGDDTVTGFASQMITLSERAAQLTHGLLAFGRKQVMNVQPTDLNELVTRVRKILQRLIGENIELKASLPENPVIAKADSTQIEQVLVNLATNSMDAMPKGGTILISTGIAEINETFIEERGYGAPGMYAKLSFSDNGAGIDRETQKRIFEPFFTTKEVGQGTGLGLSVVYGIIKQHNGFIEVRSEKGAGTEFNIYLPLAEVVVGRGARLDGIEALMGENESVLLAEDEPDVRKITRTMLEEFGYSVIEAENGEDAVTKYMEHMDSISLLIIDMVMPKKSGREAYEEIRKISPSIKVLFTSGYTRNAIDEKEIGEGLDFISKPASPGDFLRKVKEVLRR